MVQFSAKLVLEWRPGDSNEFPEGLKDELDDIQKYDMRWRHFCNAMTILHDKKGIITTDVDNLVLEMKKQGLNTRDSIMFLKKLRRLGLVRFVSDNEILMGMIDDLTFHLN